MELHLLVAERVPVPKSDPRSRFQKLIELWRDHSNAINRRLCGVKLLKADDKSLAEVVDVLRLHTVHDVEVRQFVPKTDLFSSEAFEASAFTDKFRVDFWPCVLDGKQHPHVSFRYRLVMDVISSDDDTIICELQVFADGGEREVTWMRDFAFTSLLRWLKNIRLEGTVIETHRLVGISEFSRTYRHLKENFGRQIASKWRERTDPRKFVFEDCAIAAYLIELWRIRRLNPRYFCDIGCGNGLLVHLLCTQKFSGCGIDVRRRKIWDDFTGADLRERSLNPEEDVLDGADFLIGNHSDELTPWIPVLAARSRCGFFLLPCCPFDFYGRYVKKTKANDGNSCYGSYLLYIRSICERLGYEVEEDRLKIPSTKRRCFIGLVPGGGLPSNIEEVIKELLSERKSNTFVARPKVERVRNCSQVPTDLRQQLTFRIFSYLLSIDTNQSRGGVLPLPKAADLLSATEKEQLKDSHGGLQTFLKNQHQVFKVAGGSVSIRDWATEGMRRVDGKTKIAACWFKLYHPDGCPLSNELCSFAH
uniref:tRNA (uracil-O(2)-)-methyltransferase n=1 Tax=Ascaris lumbricoides TaxID=6252 RepID=A0A0M3HEU0_ASCLU